MNHSPSPATALSDETVRRQDDSTSREIVYDYIRGYIQRHGFPPSVRDIARACQLGSTTVFYHLGRLEAEGRLSRGSHKARSLRLSQSDEKLEQK